MMLPNFIIIGAAKSGTTSLYEYLRQHPQVFMSPLKETNFFAFNGTKPDLGGPSAKKFNNCEVIYRYDDYLALFNDLRNEIAIGEVSPRYMYTPGTAYRIKKYIPDVRMIAILRNPVDRAFSHFSMHKLTGYEPCATMAQALADEPRRIRERWAKCIYTPIGYYGQQIEEYYNYFDRKQINLYLYDDLLKDPIGLIRDILRHIGVNDQFTPDMSQRHNVSGMIKNPMLRLLWTKTAAVRSVIGTRLSKDTRKRLSKFVTNREMLKLKLPAETHRQLIEEYREDILRLQDLIQRDLSGWLRT